MGALALDRMVERIGSLIKNASEAKALISFWVSS